MVFNKVWRKKILSTSLNPDNLILKEFVQSGMQRAMLQYHKGAEVNILLLTNQEDIELVKQTLLKNT